MFKLVVGAFLCGVAGVVIFLEGFTEVMRFALPLLDAFFRYPVKLSPDHTAWSLLPVAPLGVPQLLYLCFWGGIWALVLAGLIRFAHMPDLLTGFLLGAVVCTAVGFTLQAGALGAQSWTGKLLPAWLAMALTNGVWGWGTAGLMRAAGVAGDRQPLPRRREQGLSRPPA